MWLIGLMAVSQGVDPEFARQVARVESGLPRTGQEVRLGRLGRSKYFGPMGIHESFRRRWDIANPVINIWVGVRALRGEDKLRVLRRYNPRASREYLRAVLGRWEGEK